MTSSAMFRHFLALLAACGALPALAGPFAYVANTESDDVSVIDTATNTVIATVPVGDSPYGVGITRDFHYVYVANYGSNSLSVIDAKTNQVTATVADVCANPAFVEPTPDGTEMWVSCQGETRVVIVNLATNTVTRWIPAQTSPLGITFSADNSRAYIASFGNATVRAHLVNQLWQLAQIPAGVQPTDVQIEPSGAFAWVLSSYESRLTELNLASNSGNRTWWFDPNPFSLTIHPDGVRIFLTSPASGTVTRFNTQSAAQTRLDVGGSPMGIDRNADGSRLYVANENGTVAVIDSDTFSVITTIPVGTKPRSHGRFVAKGFPPPDSVPDAPTGVVATAGVAQVTVGFTPGSDGGGTILRYTAVCGAKSASAPAPPIVVADLPVGVPVACSVIATNALGDGAVSAPSNTVTPFAVVPAAPTGIVATPRDTAIDIAYTAPYDGHSPILHYTATCATPDLAGTYSVVGGASPLALVGTPNAHIYTCTVVATNAVGDSTPSLPSAPAMPDAVPPQPSVELPLRGDGQLTVAFAAAATPNGYSPITTWKVACGARLATGPASPIVITGLPNGVPQTCTVIAANARGDSVPSDPTPAVTPASVPDAPTITGVTRGNGMVRVSFLPPANTGGAAIVGYIVRCGGLAVFGGNLTLPVSGLANGVPVTCTVLARNDVGDGAVSAPSASVTPATVPDAPTPSAITGGDTQALLAFAPPAQDGGAAIANYSASCSPGDHVSTVAASPLLMQGLVNGQTYRCSVAAINELGTGAASAALDVVPRHPADLSVSIDNGTSFIPGGSATSYRIDVGNGDTAGVAGVRVRAVIAPSAIDVAWTCSAQAGSQCPASGSGDIDAMVDLAPQSGVTFVLTATIAALPEAPVSVIATVTPPNDIADPLVSNNTATDGPDAVGLFASGFQ